MKNLRLLPVVLLASFVYIVCSAADAHLLEIATPAEWATKGALPKKLRELGGVHVSVDTLDSVQARYGVAPKFRLEKGAASDDYICYLIDANKSLIVSSGPMGGWTDVTSVAYGVVPTEVKSKCVPLRNGLSFAIHDWQRDIRALEHIAASRTKATADGRKHLRYEIEIKPKSSSGSSTYCDSGVVATLSDKRTISFIQIWQSCSKG